MKTNSTKTALINGETVLGCEISRLRSADLPRVYAQAGFDFVFIDMEHTSFSLETVADMIGTARCHQITPIVRIPQAEYAFVSRVLDAGAQGIIVPRVNTPKQVEDLVSWAHYPPNGIRGFACTTGQTDGKEIDVAGYRQVERLPVGFEISLEDLQGALRQQGQTIHEGDIVLLRTGHSQLWITDNDTYNSGQPGIGLEAAKWLIQQNVAMVGADNWGIEVHPPPNKKRLIEVHQWMITKNGIYFLENLDLEELASDKAYEFAFIFAPLRLKGATGSPGNPIAVR